MVNARDNQDYLRVSRVFLRKCFDDDGTSLVPIESHQQYQNIVRLTTYNHIDTTIDIQPTDHKAQNGPKRTKSWPGKIPLMYRQ